MPPKTPEKAKANEKKPATPATAKKATTPRKPKEVVEMKQLVAAGPTQINVSYENALQSKIVAKTGRFTHILRLESSEPFTLMNSYVVPDGTGRGQQMIVMQPAMAFPFEDLPPEVRTRIYKLYFAPKGVVGDPISVEGKRKGSGETFAKAYAGGSKFRVALLAVNKKIHKEAQEAFYATAIRLEGSAALLEFLGALSSPLRALLRNVEIKHYSKTASRTSMAFLAEAKNLERLYIENGVSSESDVHKAARNFWADAHKLLEAVAGVLVQKPVPEGAQPFKKSDAVDILRFGENAFVSKDKDKKAESWDDEDKQEFLDALKAKLM